MIGGKPVSGDRQLVRCSVCGKSFNILARECSKCGFQNPQFFNMPDQARDAYVEFYHEREIYVTMQARATREGISVEDLYRKAAELYLSELAKKGDVVR